MIGRSHYYISIKDSEKTINYMLIAEFKTST